MILAVVVALIVLVIAVRVIAPIVDAPAVGMVAFIMPVRETGDGNTIAKDGAGDAGDAGRLVGITEIDFRILARRQRHNCHVVEDPIRIKRFGEANRRNHHYGVGAGRETSEEK